MQIPRPLISTPQTPSNELYRNPGQDNEILLAMLGTFSSLYSRSTVGALAVAGLVRTSVNVVKTYNSLCAQ